MPPGFSTGPAPRRARTSFYFAVFLGVGLLFFGLLGPVVLEGLRPVLWKTAPATIEAREIVKRGGSFHIEVRYAYQWDGRARVSTVFSRPGQSYPHYDRAWAQVEALPPGAVTTCRVDPADPARSVLRLGTPWFGFFLLLPLVFIFVGARGLWSTWTPPRAGPALDPPPRGRFLLPGVIALLIGLIGLAAFTVPMWQRAWASTKWMATPCTILSSQVGSHSGKKGPTYSVDIDYRYTFEGREYQGDRYGAVDGSSSGRDGKAAIVARYPQGSRAVCYVNPRRPSEALLKPGASWGLLVGLVPMIFLGVGLAVLWPRSGAAGRIGGSRFFRSRSS